MKPCKHCGNLFGYGRKGHEKSCLTPRTLERLCEIGGVPSNVGNDECWIWYRQRLKEKANTYIYLNGELITHVALELHTGEIVNFPDVVCHTCDVPGCFNPYHLFKGTHSDNALDSNKKRRNLKQIEIARLVMGLNAHTAWRDASPEKRAEWIRKRVESRKRNLQKKRNS